jgi:hypothetical protein
MYQTSLNQNSNQLLSQSKKPAARNKPDYVNPNPGSKSTAFAQNVSKPALRKPFRNTQKQGFSGPREKAFTKNEKKLESRNYKQPGSGPVAVHDLLNFQYSSGRHVETQNTTYRSRHSYSQSRRNKTFFNKEEYLQAKCKFVVLGTSDEYYINTVDTDKMVDWAKVSLVYVPFNEPPNCPVCLYPPTVAKMTKCGHIYCWSCILHYLHLEVDEKSWRKCPICHEAIHEKDLKSVEPYMQRKFDRLDSISMKLMKRSKDSIFPVPKNENEDIIPKFEFPTWLGDSYDGNSKIMLATREQIIKQLLMKERKELNVQLQKDAMEENGEAAFITMALNILDEEIKSLSAYEGISIPEDLSNKYKLDDGEPNSMSLSTLLNETSLENDCHGAEAAFSEDENEIPNKSELEQPKESNRERMVSECSTVSNDASFHDDQCDVVRSPTFPGERRPKSDSYHFYQAEDGQNIYLHSINARTLIEEYGALDDGPLKVQGQITDFDYYTMTKELRKRFRYLSHLPLSTEFMICELILKPPLLSKRTIHNFMPEFKKRKELRLKKFKEQQKFDRQASAIENKKYGFYVDPEYDDEAFGIDLANVEDFPSNLSHDSPEFEVKVVSPEPTLSNTAPSTPSFAQMLSTASTIQPPAKPREVNYTRTLPLYETPPPVRNPTNSDDDGPDVYRPDFKETFSAAMFAAPLTNGKAVETKGKGKKKKDKGTLLFATGGQRKY